MAKQYTCDICKHEIPDGEHVGFFSIRGNTPGAGKSVRLPNGRYRKRKGDRVSLNLDTCPMCTTAIHSAVDAIANPKLL